jgi:pimeloyl-ACP methyl ester carboxylesterase
MCHLIETPLGTIGYSVIGMGKPLLFLHGGYSNCRETLFHKGFKTNDFKLITPSRPGYSRTPFGKLSWGQGSYGLDRFPA